MRVVGRLAESEDPVLFATYGEVDKCEFIKVNAPVGAWEAWSSDDGAALVSGALCKTSATPQPPSLCPRRASSTGGDGGAPRGDGRTCGNEGTCCVEGFCGGGDESDVPGKLLPPASTPPIDKG